MASGHGGGSQGSGQLNESARRDGGSLKGEKRSESSRAGPRRGKTFLDSRRGGATGKVSHKAGSTTGLGPQTDDLRGLQKLHRNGVPYVCGRSKRRILGKRAAREAPHERGVPSLPG